MRKNNKRDLLNLIDQKIENGIGSDGGEISNDRQDLMDYYLGEQYGNERDGFSKVVTREVLETVEWMKPTLLRIFFGTDTVCEFDPVSSRPEDERQAKQETEYCNYVFNKENKGFLEGYNWITDALLQKVGVMKIYRDDIVTVSHETYENLSDQELVDLVEEKNSLDDKEFKVEVGSHKFNSDGTLDVKITTTHTVGKTIIESIPSEEFIMDGQHRSLCIQDTNFCCHQSNKTRSELLAMGYDEDVVDTLGYDDSLEYDEEAVNRNDKTDEQFHDDNSADPVFRYEENYIRYDLDNDGFAELLQVNKVGKTELEITGADNIPFASLCSIPLPHKYTGLCVADLVKDLQLIRSTLLRMMLDGMYQANNPRMLADANNCEISDLLNPASGQTVRGKAGSVTPIPTQAGEVIANVLPALKTLEDIKESRSGVSNTGRGLDSDVIANATKGAFDRAVDQAQDRIEMIARIFAETGFTDMFKLIRENGIKSDDSKEIRLGQEWINVHPRSWKSRNNMSINVGLGTNSKENEINALRSIIAKQEQYIAAGSSLATPQNLYNSLLKLTNTIGVKNPNLYFSDPSKAPPPPPPKPDPLMVSIEKEYEVEMAKLDQKDREAFLDNMLKMIKLEVENNIDLGPEGIGTGVNDAQQRQTELASESYSSRASGSGSTEGAARPAVTGQPPA